MNRKGFAPVLIIGIITLVVIAAAVGWYFVARDHAATPAGVACTTEAKQCPDGSYVGRTGPDCQFAACPEVGGSTGTVIIVPSSTVIIQNSTSSKSPGLTTLSDSQNIFTIQVPSSWNVQVSEDDNPGFDTFKVVAFSLPNNELLFDIYVHTTAQWQDFSSDPSNFSIPMPLLGSSSQYVFQWQSPQDIEDANGLTAEEILAGLNNIKASFKILQ